MATIVNPGQLGLFSLNNYFAASTYAPKTQWLPQFRLSDLTYNVSAVNAGVNLARAFDLQLPISIGMGYSRVFLNLGTFITTSSSGPTPIGRFESWERSESFSLGVGIDYYVRLGIGVNFDKIVSNLSPIGTEQEKGAGKADGSATDIGMLLEVPIIDIIAKAKGEPVTFGHGLSPLVNVSVGYAHQNQGRSISYVDAAQSDPLPRNVVLGISTELGLVMNAEQPALEGDSRSLLRVKPKIILIVRNADGTFEYQSGLGDISFFKHVIQGKLDEQRTARTAQGMAARVWRNDPYSGWLICGVAEFRESELHNRWIRDPARRFLETGGCHRFGCRV